jgi:multiple sugar transport system ATP-binding protein
VRILLDHVTKVYGGAVTAIDDVHLEIADGEFVVLVGPSGCGKSTLLRMIAGLESVTLGSVSIGDTDVTELAPRDRDIAMVFQDYALYPQMTVRDNLAFGLKTRRTPKPEIAARVGEVAGVLGLEDLLDRKPGRLSGGQRQRVAMGRAMVREPAAFLMDEPLSNLDAQLRVSMRGELARLHDRLGVTTVFVTHDQVEAMTLGHRVAVLRDGTLQQYDTPHALFHRPANLFVATFIGSPAMNLLPAVIEDGVARFGEHAVPLPDADARGEVILGLRPTDLEIAGPGTDAGLPRISIEVEQVEDVGADAHLVFPVDVPADLPEAMGGPAERLLADERRLRLQARVSSRAQVAPGDRLDLAVHASRAHVFDPRTGDSLTAILDRP